MSEVLSILKEVKPFLTKAWEKSGFETLTAVQQKAIPLVDEGKDVVVESPTGTGKTIAYLLPVLNQVDVEKKAPQVVILAPSRELVMQINDEIQKWSEGSGIGTGSFIGGANVKRQLEKLKKHPQVVVGSPGRIHELIKLKKLKMHEVKTIVLDEGDQLLVPEHMGTIEDIIKSTLSERQIVLFSATLSAETERIAQAIMNRPEALRIKNDEANAKVEHIYFKCQQRDKMDVLRRIIRMDNDIKALTFIKDIPNLSVIAQKLKFQGIELGVLDSDTNKQEREAALRRLRSGEIRLLLATDVAARGLDIKGLTHVVHFDVPKDKGQYIHRSGRTGRMGASGTVISIVTERDERVVRKYARELGINIKQKEMFRGQIVDAKEQPKPTKSLNTNRKPAGASVGKQSYGKQKKKK